MQRGGNPDTVGMVWPCDCNHMPAEWEELFEPHKTIIYTESALREFMRGRHVTSFRPVQMQWGCEGGCCGCGWGGCSCQLDRVYGGFIADHHTCDFSCDDERPAATWIPGLSTWLDSHMYDDSRLALMPFVHAPSMGATSDTCGAGNVYHGNGQDHPITPVAALSFLQPSKMVQQLQAEVWAQMERLKARGVRIIGLHVRIGDECQHGEIDCLRLLDVESFQQHVRQVANEFGELAFYVAVEAPSEAAKIRSMLSLQQVNAVFVARVPLLPPLWNACGLSQRH